MTARILTLTAFLLAAAAYIAGASKTEPVVIRESLSGLPMQIDRWRGRDVPLDNRVVSVLGVDDYLNREYAESTYMGLYIGFYQSQRQGSSIHSPLNCLPGSGWNPVTRSFVSVPVAENATDTNPGPATRTIRINRILIQKGIDKAVVFYWYQAHGRVIASEYWGKFYTVLDAMRMNRTDGALVRVVSTIDGSGAQAEALAETEGTRFVQFIFPRLSRYLPE
jgi:EpsI family protein